MLRKEIMFLALVANTVALADVKINFNSKIESRHVGEFYKNIKKIDFYKDEEILKYTPIDFKVSLDENIKLGVEVYKTKQKGTRNNLNPLNPRVNFSIKTIDIAKSNVTYSLIYDKYNNYYSFIEANNINHNLKINLRNKLNLIFDFDTVNGKVQKRSIILGNDTLKYTNTEILETEKHLKKVRKIQNMLQTEDDGHNHNGKVDIFSYLDYSIDNFKYYLSNSENKVEFNKDLNIKEIDTKLNMNAKYSNLDMFNSFSIEEAGQPLGLRRPLTPMTRVVNNQETKNLIFTLNKKDLKLDINLEKEFIPNLRSKFGTSLVFEKVSQDILENEIKFPRNTRITSKILSNQEVKSNNTLTNSIYADLNYLYRPISKFSLLTGLKTNLSLRTTWKEFVKEYENSRKNAYEKELEKSKKKKEELATKPEKMKEREEELARLNAKYEEEKKKLEEFINKKDYSEDIDELYKEEMKKEKNKDKKLEEIRLLRNRDDELELKNKFKSTIAKHKFDEIENIMAQKNLELEKFEKENINKDKQRNLTRSIINAKTVEERAKLIKEFADKNQMTNLSSKAGEYAELLEYRGSGSYASFKSGLLNKKAKYDRVVKAKYKNYVDKFKEIEVDPFVYNSYKVILDAKTANYSLDFLLNPYVDLRYHINNNLSLIAKADAQIELTKNLMKKTKLKHHIHFNPSFEIKYVW